MGLDGKQNYKLNRIDPRSGPSLPPWRDAVRGSGAMASYSRAQSIDGSAVVATKSRLERLTLRHPSGSAW